MMRPVSTQAVNFNSHSYHVRRIGPVSEEMTKYMEFSTVQILNKLCVSPL
jgi:hypothetical protein